MLWFHRDGDDVGKQFLACAAWLLLKINKLVAIFYLKAVYQRLMLGYDLLMVWLCHCG
jgi:hypothetical protein